SRLARTQQDWPDAKRWIQDRAGKPQRVSRIVTGTLSSFIVEPCLPHPSDAEYYICVTWRHADTLLFTTSGGVDVGDVDAKALKLDI
ncbi:hypothetical protein EDB19DRAFT_1617989, partial [Suillus lakei]